MKSFFLCYALVYGGAVAAIFNPYIGVLVYIALGIIRPDWLWGFSVGTGGNNFSRIVAGGLLIGWVLKGFGNWQFGKGSGIVLAIVGFYLWGLIAGLQGVNEVRSGVFTEEFAKMLLPFLVGMTVIDSVQKVRLLVWTIVLSMGFVAYELNLQFYTVPGINVLQVLGYGFMDNNSMAIALVTCIGLSYFLAVHETNIYLRLLVFVCMVLMAHAVMFSMSRGGMLAMIVTGVALFLLTPKRPTYILVFIAAVALAFRLAGPMVTDRFMTTFADEEERDASAQSRIDIWQDCLDSIKSRPVFGVGPYCWGIVAQDYGWTPGKEAHSLWLQTAAETGIPGLLFLVTFYTLCLGRLWPLTRERTPVADPYLRYLARMVIASLVGFAIAAQFVSLIGLELPYYVGLIGACTLKIHSLGLAPVGSPASPFCPSSYPAPAMMYR